MFNIEQSTKQHELVATGFSVNQANYINLNSAGDKQILVYVTVSFDDGSTKDETVTFSGLDYNAANEAFSSWAGLISVVEEKLGLKLTIPENIEEVFQNVPPPKEEEISIDRKPLDTEIKPADTEPVALPVEPSVDQLQ